MKESNLFTTMICCTILTIIAAWTVAELIDNIEAKLDEVLIIETQNLNSK